VESPLGRALLAAESELLAAAWRRFGWELLPDRRVGRARELLAAAHAPQSLIAVPGLAAGAT